MTRRALVALGVLIVSAVMLINAPSTLLDGVLARASAGRLHVAAASGSVWRGTGVIEIYNDAGAVVLARRVRWRFYPAHLLRGRLAFGVDVHASADFATTVFLWPQLVINDLDLSVPATAIAQGFPGLAGYGPGGQLNLHIASFTADPQALQGSATVEWHNASSQLAPVAPLGDYSLQLEGRNQSVAVTVATLKGPLQLQGGGEFTPGQRPLFNLLAQIPGELRGELAPFLQLISVEQPDGSFVLELR